MSDNTIPRARRADLELPGPSKEIMKQDIISTIPFADNTIYHILFATTNRRCILSIKL